jgi:hypothetical protein
VSDDLDPLEETLGLSASLRRPLAKQFRDLTIPRDPDQAGGVPVPDGWECLRAVLGGATRKDLETAYGGERVTDDRRLAHADLGAFRHYGRYLPRGLHVVTGQTGGGKSALVTNLSVAAARAGHPVLYVSLELDEREIAARVVGLEAGLSWSMLARGWELGEEPAAERDAAIARLADVGRLLHTYVPDGPLDLGALEENVLGLWEDHDRRTPLVVVDYLQLAGVRSPDGAAFVPQLRERIAAVTFALHRISKEWPPELADGLGWLGCPVVVLSSTARGSVRGDSAVSGMDGQHPDKLRHEDLETLKALPKEAGEIEATAVSAWVIALGERDEEGGELRGTRRLCMRLAKHRNGPVGQWLPFRFHGATGRLEEEPDRYASTPREEREEAEAARAEKETAKRRNGDRGRPIGAATTAELLGG